MASNGTESKNIKSIVLGGGCFWCLETYFQQLNGVNTVVNGYAGGNINNPSYSQFSSGGSGHAEVVQISYDPKIIQLQTLLEIFFTMHDPTTPNQQGAHIGSQYRSIILVNNHNDAKTALDVK
jgi:methionine-S-sulfoxide reductase